MKKAENMYQTDLFDPEKISRYQSAMNDSKVRSSFVVSRSELLDALRALWAYYKYSGDNKYFIKIELIVRENSVVFKVDRSERYLKSEPLGYCRARLYYQDLLDAVKSSLKREVPFIVFDNAVSVNGVKLSAETYDYDPEKDVVRNTPTLEEVSREAENYVPYSPERYKDFYSKDGKKGFSYHQVVSDAQMLHHYMEKYGAHYHEVYFFITSFLSRDKPRRL